MPARFTAKHCAVVLCCLLTAGAGSPLAGAGTGDDVAGSAIDYADRWPADLERDLTSKPAAILEFIGIKPGMQVLDLYSGGGYWSEIFAHAVGPGGSVVAHTSSAYRSFTGKMADARFATRRVPRVKLLSSEVDDLELGQARFDLIFLSLAYHDLYFYADFSPIVGRERFLMQVRAALKPDGSLIVIDHAAAEGRGALDVQALHRIEERYLRRDFETNGFVFVDSSDALRNAHDDHTREVFDPEIRFRTDRYVLRFQRAPDPPPL